MNEEFFLKLKEIDTDAKWFESLGMMMDYFDDFLIANQYNECNENIKHFMDYDFSLRLQLGLLTITNRRKKRLSESEYGGNREILYNKTEENLIKRNYNETQLNSSLRNLK